jgi:hypothetical protein
LDVVLQPTPQSRLARAGSGKAKAIKQDARKAERRVIAAPPGREIGAAN